MKHVIIKDNGLNGWQYGMLRSFEKAIIKEVSAEEFEIPEYKLGLKYLKNFGHGMKGGEYRKHFPKQELGLQTDVAWYILMGPEDYRLDLFKNWENGSKTKILYLFDTLPAQFPLIKRLCSDSKWDILITSFNDAVADLERLTGRKWHCIEQAADRDLFQTVPFHQRLIHFSSYGRRFPLIHETIKDFCNANELFYDYTTHDAKHPIVDPKELYRQYAWHISHSLFTLSWPVELTNPMRAGHLRPITCRWFEAAASGTVILGQQPDNYIFDQWIGEGMIAYLNPNSDKSTIIKKLETLWSERENLYNKSLQIREAKINTWTWSDRVNRILNLIKTIS